MSETEAWLNEVPQNVLRVMHEAVAGEVRAIPDAPAGLYDDMFKTLEGDLPRMVAAWRSREESGDSEAFVAGLCRETLRSEAFPFDMERLRAQREQWRKIAHLHRDTCLEFVREQAIPGLSEQDILVLGTKLHIADVGSDSQEPYTVATSKKNPALLRARTEYEAWRDSPNRKPEHQNRLTWRVGIAYYWPGVLAEHEREQSKAGVAKIPTAMVVGEGAIAPMFSRELPSGTRFDQTTNTLGRLLKVTVARKAAQLDILVGDSHQLTNPGENEIAGLLARVCTPGEWRFLLATMVAAERDFASGLVPVRGGFLFTPGRFGKLLGVKDRDSVAVLDERLEALRHISVKADVKRGGRPYTVTAEALIIDGGGTVEPNDGARGRGRPKARLYRIQDNVLALIQGGGSHFPLSADMLLPPQGFTGRHRDWEDAFKLWSVLLAFARTEARKATGKSERPWRRKVVTLLDASGISADDRKDRKAEQLRRLLDILQGDSRISYRWVEEDGGPWVEYDVSPAVRSEFKSIGPRKGLKRLESQP